MAGRAEQQPGSRPSGTQSISIMLNWVLARVGADMVVPSRVCDQTGEVQFNSVHKRAGKEPTVKQMTLIDVSPDEG